MKDSIKRYILLVAIFIVLIIIALIVLLIRNINKEDEVSVSNINTTNTVDVVSGSEISNNVNKVVSEETNDGNNDEDEEEEEDEYAILKKQFFPIEGFSEYFMIVDILKSYYSACWDACGVSFDQYEERSQEEMINEGKTCLKNILAKQYIEDMNINDDGIIKKAEEVKSVERYSSIEESLYSIFIEKIYRIYLSDTQDLYIVDYQFHNQKNQMFIKVENNNNTCEIYLKDYIEKYNYNNETKGEELNISKDEIKINDNNVFIERNLSAEDMVREYFSIYKNMVLNYNGELYSHLDTVYREQKYKDYSSFQEKINDLKNEIKLYAVTKYKVEVNENGKVIYRIIDNYNNQYEIAVDGDNLLVYSIKLYDKE